MTANQILTWLNRNGINLNEPLQKIIKRCHDFGGGVTKGVLREVVKQELWTFTDELEEAQREEIREELEREESQEREWID
jgi:hypothetical protein